MKQANPWVGHSSEAASATGAETKAAAARAKPMRNNTILFFIEDSFQQSGDGTAGEEICRSPGS
jgi:hypothetical protein